MVQGGCFLICNNMGSAANINAYSENSHLKVVGSGDVSVKNKAEMRLNYELIVRGAPSS